MMSNLTLLDTLKHPLQGVTQLPGPPPSSQVGSSQRDTCVPVPKGQLPVPTHPQPRPENGQTHPHYQCMQVPRSVLSGHQSLPGWTSLHSCTPQCPWLSQVAARVGRGGVDVQAGFKIPASHPCDLRQMT